jgi:hypothetical protein
MKNLNVPGLSGISYFAVIRISCDLNFAAKDFGEWRFLLTFVSIQPFIFGAPHKPCGCVCTGPTVHGLLSQLISHADYVDFGDAAPVLSV